MTQVTIHEAKTHLSELIQMALDGEEVIIAKRDKPLVKLVVIEEANSLSTSHSAPPSSPRSL